MVSGTVATSIARVPRPLHFQTNLLLGEGQRSTDVLTTSVMSQLNVLHDRERPLGVRTMGKTCSFFPRA